MMRAGYLLYGVLVLGLASLADYRGWGLMRATRVENVPRSIRDNPGAYRPVYRGIPRYPGGK
jgi:hypothetical protein